MIQRARRLALVLVPLLPLAFAAQAQDISDSHLKAARAAVDAINATDPYDDILPSAAAALKQELISKNPDLVGVITETVDEETLKLAGRRSDLEREAGLAYARVFSEADLQAIADFYQSPAGKKLLADGPIVTREVIKAADIWQRGVARDLAQNVGQSLAIKVDGATPPAEAPAAPTAPQN